MDKALQEKYENLKTIIKDCGTAIIAYSGGVDSTLLAFIASRELRENALCLTINSELIPSAELQESIEMAKEYGFKHQVLNLSVLNNSDITNNSPERCYFCKNTVFSKITELAKDYKIINILEGSNTDDLSDYRPGFKAILNLSIKSPLMEAKLSKSEIREISKTLGLKTWNKPSYACLASRIPYNETIDIEKLSLVEKSEVFISSLGYQGIRIRHHDTIARIELREENIEKFICNDRKSVELKLKEYGFKYVCLDIGGYKTGSLNVFEGSHHE
ncbi:MAG: ATP-dependent sacrificial sulfur transferase LarE [bacterium]